MVLRKFSPKSPTDTRLIAKVAAEQVGAELSLRRKHFRAVVLDIMNTSFADTNVVFSKAALDALQVAAEEHCTNLFSRAGLLAQYSRSDDKVRLPDFQIAKIFSADQSRLICPRTARVFQLNQ